MDNVVVIADSEQSKEAHQELFRYSDDNYMLVENLPFSVLSSLNGSAERLHIAGSWEYVLKIAIGSEEIRPGDVSLLMKKLGLPEDEIRPFLNAPLNDLFYTLYYGKRFDVLRRLCHHIRRTIQERFSGLMVDCHIVVPERPQIVASSL